MSVLFINVDRYSITFLIVLYFLQINTKRLNILSKKREIERAFRRVGKELYTKITALNGKDAKGRTRDMGMRKNTRDAREVDSER